MRLLPFACLLCLLCAARPLAAQEVTIYRCIGKQGQLTLRDSPCAPGETQQTRSMQRPRDPAPAAPAPVDVRPVPVPPAMPAERVVYRSAPRPMYECITPEGDRYSSDDGEGRPRWVPYWVGGWPHPVWPRPHGGSISGHIDIGRGGSLSFRSGSPTPLPPSPRPPGHSPGGHVILPAGGAWVRDECHELPQAEICAHLSDRRYEILRRYGSAMPSERRALDLEQRGIDARMANDCRTP